MTNNSALKFFIFMLIFSFGFKSNAQSESKKGNHEIGISTTSFGSYSINYKKKLNEKMYFRLTNLNFGISGATGKHTVITASTQVGLEFRSPLTNRVSFIHGPQIGFGIKSTESSPTSVYQINSSISYFGGLLYKLNNSFYIGGEISPSISFGHTSNSRGTKSVWGISANNKAMVSLVYVF